MGTKAQVYRRWRRHPKWTFISILVITFAVFGWSSNWYWRSDQTLSYRPELLLTSCTEHHNVVYIKQIKCASETLSQIFRRFVYERFPNVSAVLPIKRKIYLGWPYQMDDSYYSPSKTGGFNVLSEHSIYNKSTFSKLMPRDTMYFTSIRRPFSQLKSTLNYYRIPIIVGFENSSNPSHEFLMHADKYDDMYKKSKSKQRRCVPDDVSMTKNLMSFILGFPTDNLGSKLDKTNDNVFIDKWLNELNDTFSLVLIVERLEESIILMRRMLCWQWRDIIYLTSNARNYDYKDIENDEDIEKHRKRSVVDHKLYNFFSKELDRRVSAMPPDFLDEVSEFKNVLSKITTFCNNTKQFDLLRLPPKLPSTFLEIQRNRWSQGFKIDTSLCTVMDSWGLLMSLKTLYNNYPPQNISQPQPHMHTC